MLDPTKVYGYFNDFFEYTATDWVVSTSGTGAVAVSDTITGGAAVLTTGTGDNEHDWMQLSNDGGTDDSEVFLFATGKKAWFKARFKMGDVTQNEYMLGLFIENTDPRAAAPSDGIWFESVDATTDLDLIITKNSSNTTASGIHTMVDNTFVAIGFYWDGISTIHYFINDVEIGSIGVGTSLPDDEYVSLVWGNENGEVGAQTMTIDYIGAWMER